MCIRYEQVPAVGYKAGGNYCMYIRYASSVIVQSNGRNVHDVYSTI